MGFKTFRDRLALILIPGIPILWGIAGAGLITLPEAALGATIAMWSLCIQFYFRKKEAAE